MHLTSSRAHWALSFLALLAAFTTSDSNPDPQPVAENFNPEDADPAYAIACFGGWSDQSLPRMGSFDPTGPFDPMERTLQHLCVKPQYRGGARGQHAGGFCAPGTVNEFDKRVVVFDASPAAQISKELAQPSFLLECWYRCFCVWDDKGHQNIKPPIDFDVSLFTRPRLDTETTQISIPSRDWTPEEQEPVRDTEPDTALALRLITNLSQDKLHAGEQPQPLTTDISLDPQNEIACDGPLPIWPLPAPIGLPPFLYHDLKHLCAVNLNDGAA
ncbi:MAG: hypothetical protein LQ342_005058 [Letrouitia transgressa]|nr:MAG: hypothetical protein LQ342_005058 [Letrouitia transgressa]